MTSRKNIKIFDFNGVNVVKHWHVAGEVFAISDCLVPLITSINHVNDLNYVSPNLSYIQFAEDTNIFSTGTSLDDIFNV